MQDAWGLYDAVRRRRPAWQFQLLVERPAAAGLISQIRDYEPNYDFVHPKMAVGMHRFDGYAARPPTEEEPRCAASLSGVCLFLMSSATAFIPNKILGCLRLNLFSISLSSVDLQ